MKKELLGYLAGLCQAASAVIMPDVRVESVAGCTVVAILGAVAAALKSKGDRP